MSGVAMVATGTAGLDDIRTPAGAREAVAGGSAVYGALAGARFAPTGIAATVGADFPADEEEGLRRARVDLAGWRKVAGAAGGEVAVPGTVVLESGAARGFGVPVPVEVRVKDGVVVRVSPKLPNDESPMFFKTLEEAGLWRAWDGMTVEAAATAKVDAVASATYSSEAAIANVRAALAARAGKDGPAAVQPNKDGGGTGARGESASDLALAALAVRPNGDGGGAEAFREFDVHAEFAENPFEFFTGRGLLLCAGDREKHNAMTIGWGGLGTIWGRNDAVTVYVAESRYTREFMDRAERFTVMAFDKERQADVLAYMGSHSGRDGDKAAALGLHVAFTDAGTPYYEEARMVLECETMYAAPFDSAGMKEVPRALYAHFPAGVHTMYVGRLVRAMKK